MTESMGTTSAMRNRSRPFHSRFPHSQPKRPSSRLFGAAGQGKQRDDERSQGGLPDERVMRVNLNGKIRIARLLVGGFRRPNPIPWIQEVRVGSLENAMRVAPFLLKWGQGLVGFKAQSDGVRAGEFVEKEGDVMNPSNSLRALDATRPLKYNGSSEKPGTAFAPCAMASSRQTRANEVNFCP